LVRVFGELLGYEREVIHLYKEIGGRELIMRRKIEDDGATTWESSPIIDSAWGGKLLHLSGIDVLGPTAGSLSRLMQDREVELWGSSRIVSELPPDAVRYLQLRGILLNNTLYLSELRRPLYNPSIFPRSQHHFKISISEGLARGRAC
jgi:hypothetical protein